MTGDHHMRKALLVASLAGIAALALVACGPKPPVEVQVTLTEFGIEVSQSTFQVGQPYRFVVTNEGALAHEFMVSAPLTAGMDTGHMTEDQHMSLAVFEIEEDELQPGATAEYEFTFDGQHAQEELEFACHLEGHYEAGMQADMTVHN
jgi:uncharacterized cupredoxin-like copper-binding protein